MNTTLKHWREAATLILAAGHRLGPGSLPSRTPLTNDGRSHLPHKSCFDYDVLLLKRSSKSGFMPNAFVFPGGMADSTDFSSEWLDIFSSFRNFPNFGLRRVKQSPETRPPIFATDRVKLGSPIPGEVAFRICALRETFEESGVLLVLSKLEEKRLLEDIEESRYTDKVTHTKMSELNSSELTKWRALVNKNPSNFIRMCRELEVVPNIWALHEWGNWLTPKGRLSSRFDTVFFICCLQEIPHTVQDEKEIVHFQVKCKSHVLMSEHIERITFHHGSKGIMNKQMDLLSVQTNKVYLFSMFVSKQTLTANAATQSFDTNQPYTVITKKNIKPIAKLFPQRKLVLKVGLGG